MTHADSYIGTQNELFKDVEQDCIINEINSPELDCDNNIISDDGAECLFSARLFRNVPQV